MGVCCDVLCLPALTGGGQAQCLCGLCIWCVVQPVLYLTTQSSQFIHHTYTLVHYTPMDDTHVSRDSYSTLCSALTAHLVAWRSCYQLTHAQRGVGQILDFVCQQSVTLTMMHSTNEWGRMCNNNTMAKFETSPGGSGF